MKRRSFLSYGVGMLAASTAVAQKGIMQDGKAVVCSGESLLCPNGHKTCAFIDAPIVVGNDSHISPDMAQLFDYHVMRCQTCHVLFTRE